MSYLKKKWPKRPGQIVRGQIVRWPNCPSTDCNVHKRETSLHDYSVDLCM